MATVFVILNADDDTRSSLKLNEQRKLNDIDPYSASRAMKKIVGTYVIYFDLSLDDGGKLKIECKEKRRQR